MSAEEGQVSDGQLNSEPEGLESGEESDHDSARPRHSIPDQGRHGSGHRYRPRLGHGSDRDQRRSNWRGYGRGDSGRRQQARPVDRHDRGTHSSRVRHQHRPVPPRRENVKQREVPAPTHSRSASRERQPPSRENSCSQDLYASKQDETGCKVHHAELAKMQELITLDTVGVAPARQAFKHTCAVLAEGLDLQHKVWSAERDRGQAASFYRDPDWEAMRKRLLSGLKAIHLVCTAGLVDEDKSVQIGLSTLQKACGMSAALTNLRRPQQMPEVQAWCSSLSSLLNGTHAQCCPSKADSPMGQSAAPGALPASTPVQNSPSEPVSPASRVGAEASPETHSPGQQAGGGDRFAAQGSPSSSSAEEPSNSCQEECTGHNASAVNVGTGAQNGEASEHCGTPADVSVQPESSSLRNLGHTAERAVDSNFKPRVMFRLNIGEAAPVAPELVRRSTVSASPTPPNLTPRSNQGGAECTLMTEAPAHATDPDAGDSAVDSEMQHVHRSSSPSLPKPAQNSDAGAQESPVKNVKNEDAHEFIEPAGNKDAGDSQPVPSSAADKSLQGTAREQVDTPMVDAPQLSDDIRTSALRKSPVRSEPVKHQAHEAAQTVDVAAQREAVVSAVDPENKPKAADPGGGEATESAPKPRRRSRWDMRGAATTPVSPPSASKPPLPNPTCTPEQRRSAHEHRTAASASQLHERRRSPEKRKSEQSPQYRGQDRSHKRTRPQYEDANGSYSKPRSRTEGSRSVRSPRDEMVPVQRDQRGIRESPSERSAELSARKQMRSPHGSGASQPSPRAAATPSQPPPVLPTLPPVAVAAPGGGLCVEEEPVTPPSADEGDPAAAAPSALHGAAGRNPVSHKSIQAEQDLGKSSSGTKILEGDRVNATATPSRGSDSAGQRDVSPVSPPSTAIAPALQRSSSVEIWSAREAEQATLATGDGDTQTPKHKAEPKTADWISSLPGNLSPVTPPDSPVEGPAKSVVVIPPQRAKDGKGEDTFAVKQELPPLPKEEKVSAGKVLSSSARVSPHHKGTPEHVPALRKDVPPQSPLPPAEDMMMPPPSRDAVRSLVADGRLLLLVNLEGTLIDVAKPSSVDKWPPEQQHQLQMTVASQSPVDTSLLQLPETQLWIKMRPGWQQCMRKLVSFYALRLVSDLRPEVVAEIKHAMDPKEQLFHGTVQSRSRPDGKKKPIRQLQHASGFPALSPVALILDNKQSQLWQGQDMAHVMHCERYCFFPRPSMGIAAPCLLAAGRDEAAQDSVLLYATEALLRTHARFYQKLLTASSDSGVYRRTSACDILAEELSTVLQGCTMMLSSCASSLKEKQVDHLVDLGNQFGAKWLKCETGSPEAEQVTHIIAVSGESTEVLWGAETRKAVVKPAWLLCCGITWRRVPEDDFTIL